MFSISKPFKVKSWRQSDCRRAPCSRLTLPLRVFAGLQVPHLTLPSTGIKALKKLVFSAVQKTFKIARVKDADFDAWNVHLNSVLVWAIREQHLHSCNSEDKEFNIKLDGRPLGGVFSFE